MVFARFNVENLSTLGMGAFCMDPLPPAVFAPGRKVAVAFTLDRGPELKATALLSHVSGPTLGLAFQPPLEGTDLERVTRWLRPRFEEAQRHWDGRAALRAQAERSSAPRPGPSGILLVSSDGDLTREVAEALDGAQEVRTVPPVLAPLKEAMDARPPFVVILPCSGSLDECHRLKALMEKVAHPCPVVVMNTGGAPDAVNAFAKDVKATLSTDRARVRPVFFRRLVLGLIRKHWTTKG